MSWGQQNQKKKKKEKYRQGPASISFHSLVHPDVRRFSHELLQPWELPRLPRCGGWCLQTSDNEGILVSRLLSQPWEIASTGRAPLFNSRKLGMGVWKKLITKQSQNKKKSGVPCDLLWELNSQRAGLPSSDACSCCTLADSAIYISSFKEANWVF